LPQRPSKPQQTAFAASTDLTFRWLKPGNSQTAIGRDPCHGNEPRNLGGSCRGGPLWRSGCSSRRASTGRPSRQLGQGLRPPRLSLGRRSRGGFVGHSEQRSKARRRACRATYGQAATSRPRSVLSRFNGSNDRKCAHACGAAAEAKQKRGGVLAGWAGFSSSGQQRGRSCALVRPSTASRPRQSDDCQRGSFGRGFLFGFCARTRG
jgi:hypothetical protein